MSEEKDIFCNVPDECFSRTKGVEGASCCSQQDPVVNPEWALVLEGVPYGRKWSVVCNVEVCSGEITYQEKK